MSDAEAKPGHLRPVDIEPEADRARRMIREQSAELLRSWLERVEAGDIDELMLVGLRPDGETTWAATGTRSAASRIGALEVLKHDMVAVLLEDDEDSDDCG